TVILGHVHYHGVWYYFAVLWLLKTPVLLLAATTAGLWRAVRSASAEPAVRLLAVNLAVGLLYFSFLFQAQIGYRFVLMLLPLAYMIAARGLRNLEWTRRTALVAAAVCTTAV